jgi:hypothetical protein
MTEDHKDHPGVKKIKEMYDHGDFETIERMVKFWEAMESLGKLGEIIKRFIMWTAVIATAYFAASGAIEAWVKGISRQ